jgi:hypothetical protein
VGEYFSLWQREEREAKVEEVRLTVVLNAVYVKAWYSRPAYAAL